MAADSFLFFPADWKLGTMHLSFIEKGCYMELLILQFANKGKFTEEQAKKCLNGKFKSVWNKLSPKFKTDGEYYWNERLRKEIDKMEVKPEVKSAPVSLPVVQPVKEPVKENVKPVLLKTVVNKFNTRPTADMFGELPEGKRIAAQELYYQVNKIKLSDEQVNKFWGIFKEQHLTGEEYHPNEGKVYSYFITWIRTQKNDSIIQKNITATTVTTAPPIKNTLQEKIITEINAAYKLYLSDMLTTVSVDVLHYDVLKKSGLLKKLDADAIIKEAQEFMKSKKIELTKENTNRFCKKFSVLKFYEKEKQSGKNQINITL